MFIDNKLKGQPTDHDQIARLERVGPVLGQVLVVDARSVSARDDDGEHLVSRRHGDVEAVDHGVEVGARARVIAERVHVHVQRVGQLAPPDQEHQLLADGAHPGQALEGLALIVADHPEQHVRQPRRPLLQRLGRLPGGGDRREVGRQRQRGALVRHGSARRELQPRHGNRERGDGVGLIGCGEIDGGGGRVAEERGGEVLDGERGRIGGGGEALGGVRLLSGMLGAFWGGRECVV